eukprot:gene30735-35770_t
MQGPKEGANKEVNFDLDVASFCSDDFRMFSFKVKRCPRSRPHDWTQCPFAHPGEKAKRRDITRYRYSGTACPEFRRNGSCRRVDACPYAHGVFECWLHPSRYRTQECSDGVLCKRRVCFFAHTEEELRKPEDAPAWLQNQMQSELDTKPHAQNQMQALQVFSNLMGGNVNQNVPTQEMLNSLPVASLAALFGITSSGQNQQPAAPQEDPKVKLLQQLLSQQLGNAAAPVQHQPQSANTSLQLLNLLQQQQQQSMLPPGVVDMQRQVAQMQQMLGVQDSAPPAPPVAPPASLKSNQSQNQQATLDALLSMLGMSGVGGGQPVQEQLLHPSMSTNAAPSLDGLDLQQLLGMLGSVQNSQGEAVAPASVPVATSSPMDAARLSRALDSGNVTHSEVGSCSVTPEKGGIESYGTPQSSGSTNNYDHNNNISPQSLQHGGVDLNALAALFMQQQGMGQSTQAAGPDNHQGMDYMQASFNDNLMSMLNQMAPQPVPTSSGSPTHISAGPTPRSISTDNLDSTTLPPGSTGGAGSDLRSVASDVLPLASTGPASAAVSGVGEDQAQALLSLWADISNGAGGSDGGEKDLLMKNAKALLESLSVLKLGEDGGPTDPNNLIGGGGGAVRGDVSTAVKSAMSRNDSFDMILSELPRNLSDIVSFSHNTAPNTGAKDMS